MYCIIEATDRHEASRGLSATAGLLVFSDASKITENVVHKYCLIKWIVKFLNKMYNKKRKKKSDDLDRQLYACLSAIG